MKSKIISIIAVCVILMNCTPVFANTIIGDNTLNEIKEQEDLIIQDFNLFTDNPINKEDIDYSKIIKTYPSMSRIFETDGLNIEKMQNYIKDADCSYYVPYYCDGSTYLATVSKRVELTEQARVAFTDEEIVNYESMVGKLIVKSVEEHNEIVDYKGELEKALADNNIEDAQVYFMGGLSDSIRLAAVICTDNPDDTKIKIIKQFSGKTDGGSELDKNVLYSYNEIKVIVDNYLSSIDDIPEGQYLGASVNNTLSAPINDNSKIIIISAISGVAVLAIVIAAICIVKKKKKEKYNNL